jgi:hypothetical protein
MHIKGDVHMSFVVTSANGKKLFLAAEKAVQLEAWVQAVETQVRTRILIWIRIRIRVRVCGDGRVHAVGDGGAVRTAPHAHCLHARPPASALHT